MKRILCSVAAIATMLAMPNTTAAAGADLQVKRIALFNSGVGYFQCEASVQGSDTAELRFRTDQINDILKSLVVQDLGGGTVGVVSYASQDPVDKALKSFGVDITGKPSLAQLLDQLRGEPVELAGPQPYRGVILGVERQKRAVGDTAIDVDVLTVLSESGARQFDLNTLTGIKLTNAKVSEELTKALATLASSHNADKKSVTLNFTGTGQRNVRAAYLLETPIWKTSYRLVLSDDKKPFLQGWATVENATEEDWNNVRLSLVSGRPISFRMDLYTPLYVPRPLEQLELYASLRPPEFEGAMDRAEPAMSFARKAGRAAGGMPGAAPMMAAPTEAYFDSAANSESAMDMASSVESVATAREAGELFEYVIDAPVTLPRQHSAMLPILNNEVEGTKVSIYNPSTHPKHPLNGLEFTNSTALNLMQGPITVFDGGVYAGDAKLPNLSPSEKRLVAYALDLSTEVSIENKPTIDQVISMRISKGTLIHKHKYVETRGYSVKNKAAKPRDVIIEQPYDSSWTLIEPKQPYEKTERLLRFKLTVPPTQSAPLAVSLERLGETYIALSDVDFDSIRLFLQQKVISPKVKEALERVVQLRTDLDRLQRSTKQLETTLLEAEKAQTRVRENLKALPQNTDQYARQLQAFDAAETRIEQQRQQVEAARKEQESKQRELETYLTGLEIE